MEQLPIIERWTDFLVAQGRSEGTIRRYRYAVLRFFSEARIPGGDVAATTEEHVVSFLARLGKRAAARQLYVQALRSFFRWAVERGVVAEDPTRHLRPKAPISPPPDAYSPEEVVALVLHAMRKSPRRGNAILACYALGLRRSELCGIRSDDIDWSGRRVYIREAKGDRPRWVEANEIALGALMQLRTQSPRGLGDYPVVGMHPQWFTMIVNQAAAAAGLPPGRRKAHMLRASAATHMLGNGVPISVVSRLLGHSNVAVTSRYLAVSNEDRRKAVDSLSLAGVG